MAQVYEGENTIADLRYDRAMDDEGVIDTGYDPESRYGERSVEFTRFDLAEVFGTQLTDITEALVEVETEVQLGKSNEHRDAFLVAVEETHNLSAADVDAVISNGYISIVANPMSLGFIGKLSVAVEDGGIDETPTGPV